MSDPILRIEGLRKSYRKLVAVQELNLDISPGEFVGFIGPNGAGKSTTMNCIAGLVTPDSGSIRVAGIDVSADTAGARTRLGFVPQHLDLYGYLTGQEYLEFVADIRGVERGRRDADVEDLLRLTELWDARHRVVKEYSGGMARKLAICGALVGAPPLLLLDESFVGLDPESTHRIRRRLAAHREAGGAILLSSHILEMLERICDRVVMLVGGAVVVDQSMLGLKAKFVDEGYEDLTDLYLDAAGKRDTISGH